MRSCLCFNILGQIEENKHHCAKYFHQIKKKKHLSGLHESRFIFRNRTKHNMLTKHTNSFSSHCSKITQIHPKHTLTNIMWIWLRSRLCQHTVPIPYTQAFTAQCPYTTHELSYSSNKRQWRQSRGVGGKHFISTPVEDADSFIEKSQYGSHEKVNRDSQETSPTYVSGCPLITAGKGRYSTLLCVRYHCSWKRHTSRIYRAQSWMSYNTYYNSLVKEN